jgi:hydroxymethylbilane synthase
MNLRIGTRGSALALWQAHHIRDRLLALRGRDGAPRVASVEIVVIRTTGDRIQSVPLSEVGGKGLFTKELEEALLAGAVDLAVHSMKDMPSELPDGLALIGVPERADPRDALVLPAGAAPVVFDPSLPFLARGAVVGTSSLRRKAQLLALRPDLMVIPLRGNVDTRLGKLDARVDGLEAILLACAGLERLGLGGRVSLALPPTHMVPAVGQGALALEAAVDREDVRDLVAALAHAATEAATTAERAFLATLEGNCKVPLAAHAIVSGQRLRIEGLVASVTGELVLRDAVDGGVDDAEALGVVLGGRLIERGADRLLDASRDA